MDFEKAKKRQNLKVIISEIIMFMVVVMTVIVLAFVVSGYWINEKFEVERQGMLQIASLPTGADVIIDDESSWLQKTNTSKVLPVGDHVVTLTKEGYDTWSKTVSISEGLLHRVHYPRLFPLERHKSTVYDAVGTSKVFVSDNNEKILLYSGDPTAIDTDMYSSGNPPASADLSAELPSWKLLELKSRTVEPKPVTLRTLYDFFKTPDSNPRDSVEDYDLQDNLLGSEELLFAHFYDDQYLIVLDGSLLTIYKRGEQDPVLSQELSFVPEESRMGGEDEFVVFSNGPHLATLDMELMAVKEWAVESDHPAWLDSSMLYVVADGELIVYDYDGLNRRSIAKGVSERFPVIIVGDEWLYYFSDDNLMRENLKV